MMKTSKAYVEFKKIEGIFLLGRSGAWKSRKDNYGEVAYVSKG